MKTRFLRDMNGKIDKRYTIAKDSSYIRDKKTGKLLNGIHIGSQGYRVISITINGIYYNQIKLAILNWIAHHGKIPKGYEIHHNAKDEDGNFNKLNDHINSLMCLTKFNHKSLHMKERTGEKSPRYGTHHSEEWKKNLGKRMSGEKNFNYGKDHSGEKAGNAKLKNKDVKKIRYLGYIKKWTIQKIANHYGRSLGCINGILQGYRWNKDNLTKDQLIIQTMGGDR